MNEEYCNSALGNNTLYTNCGNKLYLYIHKMHVELKKNSTTCKQIT